MPVNYACKNICAASFAIFEAHFSFLSPPCANFEALPGIREMGIWKREKRKKLSSVRDNKYWWWFEYFCREIARIFYCPTPSWDSSSWPRNRNRKYENDRAGNFKLSLVEKRLTNRSNYGLKSRNRMGATQRSDRAWTTHDSVTPRRKREHASKRVRDPDIFGTQRETLRNFYIDLTRGIDAPKSKWAKDEIPRKLHLHWSTHLSRLDWDGSFSFSLIETASEQQFGLRWGEFKDWGISRFVI